MKRNLLWIFCLLGLASCGHAVIEPQVILKGRAVLPADTFVSGPGVGVALGAEINGRKLPFDNLPVQGFSSLIPLGDDQYLALQDNGFGTKKNSPDYPLGWFLIKVEFGKAAGQSGAVTILKTTHLSDPNGLFPYALENPDVGRIFTGADLDPESFVLLPDGTLWVGDEFGPWLLHFSSEGQLIAPTIGLPTPEAMQSATGGEKEMRSPDHPDVIARHGSGYSIPRSGGLEGMALSHDGKFLFVAVEKAVKGDDQPTRRLIMEFDLASASFTNQTRYFMAVDADVYLAALETWGTEELLVTERDAGEGAAAKIKRIYRLKLDATTVDGFLKKELLCDLMNILDSGGLTTAEPGALGLGKAFTFPFVTPEVLVAIDNKTILVANDNNYPMSCGRRPANTPDDTEFILLELP